MIMQEITSCMSSFLARQFCHEQRDRNGEVHRPARIVTSFEVGHHIWFTDSPEHLCLPKTLLVE